MLARSDFGIGALEAVEPDDRQRLIFVVGRHRDGGGRPFAGELDDIALGHAERLHRAAWQAGESASAFFLSGGGHLQADGLFLGRGFAVGHVLNSLRDIRVKELAA